MDVPNRSFRLNAQRVFLTFSQTGHWGDLNELMGFHVAQLPPYQYYVLGHELHQDGGHHYHCVIVFQKKLNVLNSRFFDWMFEAHPNIKSIPHGRLQLDRRIKYVKKDGDFVEDGDAQIAPAEKVGDIVAKAAADGKSDQELFQMYPGYFLIHQRCIKDLRFAASSWADKLEDYRAPTAPDLFSDWFRVYNWLQTNIRGPSRPPREPNLWLWGPPRVGKSTLFAKLAKMVSVFDAPREKWITGYSDAYELVVFDDFGGWIPLHDLNAFCQGIPSKVNQKSGLPVSKKKNPAVLVTCNRPPEQVYPNVFEKDSFSANALLSRFIVVEVKDFYDFWP